MPYKITISGVVSAEEMDTILDNLSGVFKSMVSVDIKYTPAESKHSLKGSDAPAAISPQIEHAAAAVEGRQDRISQALQHVPTPFFDNMRDFVDGDTQVSLRFNRINEEYKISTHTAAVLLCMDKSQTSDKDVIGDRIRTTLEDLGYDTILEDHVYSQLRVVGVVRRIMSNPYAMSDVIVDFGDAMRGVGTTQHRPDAPLVYWQPV